MINKILALVVGFFATCVVMLSIEIFGHTLYPPPSNIMEPAIMQAFVDQMPTWVNLYLLSSAFFGSLAGGLVTSFIAKEKKRLLILILATIIGILGIINLAMFKHPVWFIFASVCCYFSACYLGYLLSFKLKKND